SDGRSSSIQASRQASKFSSAQTSASATLEAGAQPLRIIMDGRTFRSLSCGGKPFRHDLVVQRDLVVLVSGRKECAQPFRLDRRTAPRPARSIGALPGILCVTEDLQIPARESSI